MLDEFQPASENIPHTRLIQYVTDRPGHDRRYAMNIDKIKRDLGWAPRHSLSDGLRATVEWYLSNSAWMNAIQKQRDYQKWVDQNYQKREKEA
jgi:dTDP-glucose 4,6-dehydratase